LLPVKLWSTMGSCDAVDGPWLLVPRYDVVK
jgi:hypothetical protein